MLIKTIIYNLFKFFNLLFLIIIFFNFNIFKHINNLISFYERYIEFKKCENYLKYCNKNILEKEYKKLTIPKISIITPVFNRERYISRFLKSIQNQLFYKLEIILIDDCSIDNSIKIIQKYKKQDKRLLLLKNKKNKGTLISRNIGVLYSKGKYIILPDPDDIINKNIFNICYKYAEKYNYEMIRFNMYTGNKKILYTEIIKNLEGKAIYQPELSKYLYYGNNELEIIDCYITNKFIKKDLYIRSINYIKDCYLKIYMIFMEDSIINYILYRLSNSFFFVKNIGYYYIKNNFSITNNLSKISFLRIIYIFITLKFIFEYSKNTKYEKDMSNLIFIILYQIFNIEQYLLKYIAIIKEKKLNKFFYDIISLYLNSNFISKENKFILTNLKEIIKSK